MLLNNVGNFSKYVEKIIKSWQIQGEKSDNITKSGDIVIISIR